MTVTGFEEVEVVGESQYQDALLALAGGSRPYGGVELDAVAELSPDPVDTEKVAVLIQDVLVGYLRREDAVRLSGVIDEALENRGVVTCKALIRGGWDRGRDVGRFGVVLFLPQELRCHSRSGKKTVG